MTQFTKKEIEYLEKRVKFLDEADPEGGFSVWGDVKGNVEGSVGGDVGGSVGGSVVGDVVGDVLDQGEKK